MDAGQGGFIIRPTDLGSERQPASKAKAVCVEVKIAHQKKTETRLRASQDPARMDKEIYIVYYLWYLPIRTSLLLLLFRFTTFDNETNLEHASPPLHPAFLLTTWIYLCRDFQSRVTKRYGIDMVLDPLRFTVIPSRPSILVNRML